MRNILALLEDGKITAIVAMKDYKRTGNMNNNSSRRRRNYDKDMDQAFTLIFHNIKRLQDGHLCTSDPTLLLTNVGKRNIIVTEKPEEKPQRRMRKRSRSETFLAFVQEKTSTNESLESQTEENSSQRRKVRFAVDCEHHRKVPLSRTVSEPQKLHLSPKRTVDD